jgi:carbamoyltransferase
MRVLGISAYYHDSAAALIEDGVIIAAAQEERFSRKKHDASFPVNAVKYCLAEAGVQAGEQLDAVAFYDKPLKKFHRILETYFCVAPSGLGPFMQAVPLWLKEKLWIEPEIRSAIEACGFKAPETIYFPEHHESHGASAFFPSPFEEAAVLTIDGVGEWATATIAVGEANKLKLLKALHFPHSLGLLYSAFTYFTGFRVNSGEYKLMGLAPYGEPRYQALILKELMDLKEDGSFRLNMEHFAYLDELVMTRPSFHALFGGPPRQPESPITLREMDIARSIQGVTEEIVLRMAKHARELSGKRYLCLAGGVALNCVANGKLLRSGIFDDIWIQPAAGDAGGALGAALTVWHNVLDKPRTADNREDRMQGAYLGPEFSAKQIREYLEAKSYPFSEPSEEIWAETIADLIADDKVVGLLQGRMEFGPRALGNRSIIGDARSPKMQSVMNLKIKYRESFRPFAPSCLEEKSSDFFELETPSPYMLLVAPVRPERCSEPLGDERELDLKSWVNRPRSDVPAITHVDYSARVQTVNAKTNPGYHKVIKAFEKKTGYGILINTSFNVRGEPIVCTPEDAYRCFMRTEMDVLVLGPFLLHKHEQPNWQDKENWQETFQLD